MGSRAKPLVFFLRLSSKKVGLPAGVGGETTWQGLPCAGPNRTTHQAAGWESLRHSRFFKNPCITLPAPAQNRCSDDLPRWKDARIHKRMEGFSHETKPSQHKLGDFLEGKGFYIVLFLCVAAIGISGYFLFSGLFAQPEGFRGENTSAVSGQAEMPQEDAAGQTDPAPPGGRYGRYLSPGGHASRLHRHRGHPGGQPRRGGSRFLWLRLAGGGQRRSGLQPGGLRL